MTIQFVHTELRNSLDKDSSVTENGRVESTFGNSTLNLSDMGTNFIVSEKELILELSEKQWHHVG